MADLGHKETDKRLERLERRIKKEYEKAAEEISKKTRDYMSQFEQMDKAKRALVEADKMTEAQYKHWRLGKIAIGKRWEDMRDTIVDDWFNADKIARKLVNNEMVDIYALNRNFAEYQIERGMRMNTSFTLYNHKAVERLIKDNPKILPNPGKKTARAIAEGKAKRWSQRKLQSIVTQSVLQGESIPNIAKRLTREMGEMSKNAAIRNARTMTTAAEAAGRIDAYKEAEDMGIKVRQMWVATLDDRTRHEHAMLDGQVVDVGTPFEVDGIEIMFPGDPACDEPSMIYNCRCTVVPVVEGSQLAEKGIEGMERNSKLGDMSYEEWKEEKQEQNKDYDEPEHEIVDGHDISDTWERRPDQFDFEINDVIDAQGFDGNPRVVDADEFDRAVQESEFIAQRVYSAPDQETLDAYREQLYNGDWYVDCSTGGAHYGQGMYCASNYDGKLTDGMRAEMHAYKEIGESKTEKYFDGAEARERRYQMALDEGNNIISKGGSQDEARRKYDDIMNIPEMDFAKKYAPELLPRKGVSNIEIFTLDPTTKSIRWDKLTEMQKQDKDEAKRQMDVGAYGALKGYDAIITPGTIGAETDTIILNRTKVIFRRP